MTSIYLAALCAIGCSYEGYDTGKIEKDKCACINYYEPSDFTVKKVKQKPKPRYSPESASE